MFSLIFQILFWYLCLRMNFETKFEIYIFPRLEPLCNHENMENECLERVWSILGIDRSNDTVFHPSIGQLCQISQSQVSRVTKLRTSNPDLNLIYAVSRAKKGTGKGMKSKSDCKTICHCQDRSPTEACSISCDVGCYGVGTSAWLSLERGALP